MWSSTASTASTIPHDENWAFPVESDILNNCYKDRDFFNPLTQFNENYIFNVFDESNEKKNIFEKQLNNNDIKFEQQEQQYHDYHNIDNKHHHKSNVVTRNVINRDEIIYELIKKKFYIDNRTLAEIYADEKKKKKQRALSLQKFIRRPTAWNLPYHPEYKKVDYLDRSYCYPKIMCTVGLKVMSTKTIIQYVKQGIFLFLIDIRFGSPIVHKKIIENIQLARQSISKGYSSDRVFGFAFLIHGSKLRIGLLYKNQNIYLDRDSIIIITCDRSWSAHGTHQIFYANFSDYIEILQIGDKIDIGNKEIIVIVNGKTKTSVICTVIKDGLLKKRMLIQVPLIRRTNPIRDLTHEQEEDIQLAINLGCDYLITPCISEKLRSHINWVVAVRNRIIIVLHMIDFSNKLTENDINKIFQSSDGIYICGNGQNENHQLREYIVKEAFVQHKLIVRGGIINSENCLQKYDKETLKHLFLYTDCIVFSPYSNEISQVRKMIRNIYPEMNIETFRLSLGPICYQDKSLENTFCKYILSHSFIYKIPFIAIVNNNGEFVKLLAIRRPLVPIIATFLDIPTARSCVIYRNVYSCIHTMKPADNWNEEISLRLKLCIKYAKILHCIHRNEPFLFCYDSVPGLKYCDTVRLLMANKYL